ncbi:MAG: NAD(P)-dependent oxidoreductase [Anaerolineales bacterium]
MRIHILDKPSQEARDLLMSNLDKSISISFGADLPKGEKVEGLVAGRPTQDHLEQLESLRFLIVPWAGIPSETISLLVNNPKIQLYNLHHNAAPAAELALALLLAAAKRVIRFDQELRRNDWSLRYQESETVLLEGKRALILGYGSIGQRIKKSLEGLGITVQVIKRSLKEGDSRLFIFPPSKLKDLLPETEILILALPLTDETRGMITETELSLLPKNAILINISRGKIVDQRALFTALKENKIFGAGLDVWYNYPKHSADRVETRPADYPFHELDNVVMSPHRGGLVEETERLRMIALARSLNAAAKGGSIPNSVNLGLGY